MWMWESVWLVTGERHVVPLEDYRPHSYTRHCWCRPDEDAVPGSAVWVHNSLDRRELIETGVLHPS